MKNRGMNPERSLSLKGPLFKQDSQANVSSQSVYTHSWLLICHPLYSSPGTAALSCIHDHVVRILRFLHICATRKSSASTQTVSKFVGCNKSTTVTLRMDTGCQQPVRILINRCVWQARAEKLLMSLHSFKAVRKTVKLLFGRAKEESTLKTKDCIYYNTLQWARAWFKMSFYSFYM